MQDVQSKTLLIATRNAHKTEEIREILAAHFPHVIDLNSLSGMDSPEETGETFIENAQIKASAAAQRLPDQTWVLADDSGLEVDGLNGAPGVRSARFAGANAVDAANRAKLMATVDGFNKAQCQARFVCAMALVFQGEVSLFEGKVEGRVIAEERGSGGFGYDSLFIPDGYEQTFAELSPEIKNQLSHRARALEKLATWLACRK